MKTAGPPVVFTSVDCVSVSFRCEKPEVVCIQCWLLSLTARRLYFLLTLHYCFKAQKELLDAELDVYNASTNGENAVALKRKLNLLKSEVGLSSSIPL